MDKMFFGPAEVAGLVVTSGVNKSKLGLLQMFVLAILAGAFIGFGGYGFIVMIATSTIDPGMAKYVGALIFPVGLMMVVMCGAELFTGNNLMTLALMDGKISAGKMLRNWIVVYIGNAVGSYLLAYAIFSTGLVTGAVADKIAAVATAKAGLSFGVAISRAILCNIIVVLAVWFSTAAKDVVGKVFAILFPIALFVYCGYEHSVANMFFIPLGQLAGANVTTAQAWFNNILPVTLGNIIGGAVIIPVFYYLTYLRKEKIKDTKGDINVT